jgi:hypothetical protein
MLPSTRIGIMIASLTLVPAICPPCLVYLQALLLLAGGRAAPSCCSTRSEHKELASAASDATVVHSSALST